MYLIQLKAFKNRIYFQIFLFITFFSLLFYIFINTLYVEAPNISLIIINEVTLSDNTLIIKGDTTNSALNYKNFNYYKKGEDIYVKFNYNTPIIGKSNSSFYVEISDVFSNVKNVYLYDDHKSNPQLIFQRWVSIMLV